jgi:glycosyltransferase involved in cell wall biosynthesis
VGHTGLNLPGLAEWVAAADIRPVLMLHDIIPITHPQHCREGEKARHEVRVQTLLRIAHAVLGNSQDTLDILAAHAMATGQRLPDRRMAVWPGTPRLALPPGSRPPPGRDFIVLGTIEGRKNHMLLLRVWERLVAEWGEAAPRLVIIGRRGWACDDVLARLDAGGFGSRVEETGPLDDRAIANRLAGACALLFPSFAEGYGLPLVEALDAGVPVIASTLNVFREIGQNVPDLLPPDDVDGWARTILAYAAPDSPARAAQMARLAGFRAPDWPGHFRTVDAFLATLQA